MGNKVGEGGVEKEAERPPPRYIRPYPQGRVGSRRYNPPLEWGNKEGKHEKRNIINREKRDICPGDIFPPVPPPDNLNEMANLRNYANYEQQHRERDALGELDELGELDKEDELDKLDKVTTPTPIIHDTIETGSLGMSMWPIVPEGNLFPMDIPMHQDTRMCVDLMMAELDPPQIRLYPNIIWGSTNTKPKSKSIHLEDPDLEEAMEDDGVGPVYNYIYNYIYIGGEHRRGRIT